MSIRFLVSTVSKSSRRLGTRPRTVLARVMLIASLASALASPAGAQSDADSQVHALKKAIIGFTASALTLHEAAASPPPHVEILFGVDGERDAVHPHHLPAWLRVSFDRQPVVEHTYTDREWHALAEGALHLLVTAPATTEPHTLTVHFKGVDRNARSYLRTKTFSFEAVGPSDHRVLKFHAPANDDPTFTLEPLGPSLLRSASSGRPTDDLVYRIGLFESASGNHPRAAGYFLAALDPKLPGSRRADARLRLAESYAAVGAPEEALALLEQFAAEASDAGLRARAWFLIERIAAHEGRHQRVLEAHSRIGSALPPELAGEANALAGLSALALRAYSRAEEMFRAVPKSSQDAPLALFGQAQALAGMGDAFTAGTLFGKAGQMRSLFDPIPLRVAQYAHAALGFQMVAQGRYTEAIAQLGRVPPDHELSDASLFAIGWCLRQTGEHVRAIAVFDDLLSRTPQGRYAHEARLASAASYADLRAPTRSVAAYHATLDALTASSVALDQLRDLVRDPSWDPLATNAARSSPEARRLLSEDPSIRRAMERYRWLQRFRRELQAALDHFPKFLAAPLGTPTLGGRLQTVDGAQLLAQGRDLLERLDVVARQSRNALSAHVVAVVGREQVRIEEWSVAASLGIARNLRDDLGGEGLSLE